jgi:hypothetical protein
VIDLYNLVAVGACCLVVGAVVVSFRENRKTGTVGLVAAFIIGLAFHSALLHEKARRNWRFPWDHDEKEDEDEESRN